MTEAPKPYVWIIGFPRCGGASLCEALRILGWKAIHNPRHWDDLQGHNAAADILITAHWFSLWRAFPFSRLILNTRPFDDWVKSLQRIPGFWRSPLVFDRFYQMAVYGTNDPTDKRALRAAWDAHHRAFYECVPGKAGLIFSQPFSWQPLCDFLGVPVPDRPFPWRNRGHQRDARVNAPCRRQNL